MAATVAFIGLGNMGRPMAGRLLERGFLPRLYNRTASRAAELIAAGATGHGMPSEAATGADFVITMLTDDTALRETALGADGFAAAMPSGSIHLSMSTASPDVNRQLAEVHRSRGAHLVAAPVMGRPDVAASGSLWILAAGPSELAERCAPLFEALGRGHTWLGEDPGLANVAKIGANFLLVNMVEAAAESFTLAEKNGLSPAAFFEIARMLLPAPAFEGYAKRMLERQFQPAGFGTRLALKDVGLALGLAQAGPAPTPLASLARDRLLAGIARGRGDWDLAALVEVAREDAGLG